MMSLPLSVAREAEIEALAVIYAKSITWFLGA